MACDDGMLCPPVFATRPDDAGEGIPENQLSFVDKTAVLSKTVQEPGTLLALFDDWAALRDVYDRAELGGDIRLLVPSELASYQC